MEVVFHFQNIEVVSQIGSYYIPVRLLGQVLLISSYFTTSLGGRAGRADAGYTKIKANLPVELNWGLAELGKNKLGQSL